MANKEISELTSKATPVGTDELEIQETGGGTSKKITLNALFNVILGLETEVATTSGSSQEFTGISGAKRITILLDQVSGSSTGQLELVLGDSGGYETSGYLGGYSHFDSSSVTTLGSSADFEISVSNSAAMSACGIAVLTLEDSTNNTWALSSVVYDDGNNEQTVASGTKALSGELDRIKIELASGTFDAGAFNILVE